MSNRLGWIRSRCRAGEKILDIGSASGFTFRGTELEPHVTFVDLDLYDMPNFLQMDAHHLTLPDQAYDVAILGDILEHVDDPVQVIREARRVAKRLIITVPDEANWSEAHHPYSTPEDIVRQEHLGSREEVIKKASPEAIEFRSEGNYRHCFHNRFYSEESLRGDLEKAGILDYDFKRLQYDGWSWFTVEAPKLTKLPSDISPKELEAQFDRNYFSWDGKGEAKGYKGIYADFPERLKFLDYIKSLKPESVLEAGAAYGFLVKSLNDAGIPAEGFDVSTFAHKMRVTDKVRVASVLDLSRYGDKQFDLEVDIELLEHIPEAYTDQALRELARVSKRGVHWIAYKEVDDLFQTKDITHINIKPYRWWVEKVAEICGPTHTVVYKETDWYPKPIVVPSGGPKRGLNVGSFVSMLLNTDTTEWLNIDILDLDAYAKAYGYNFQRIDARKLPFPDNNFDYIVASHFLEHLSPEEGMEFLRGCHRVLNPDGVMRLAVPDAEVLIERYVAGEYYVPGTLGYFDEINPECEKADTQLGKLNALLLGNHKSVYDWETLRVRLEEAGFKPTVQSFNGSSRPDLMNQIFDYHPDLSLYVEAIPTKETIPAKVYSGRKDKLKIALLSTPFLKSPPDHYGGLEVVVANLAAGLAELGQDVTLFAAKGSKPIGDYEVFETVDPVLSYGTDWGKVDWYETEKAHYETFKDKLRDFDIVHSHTWFHFPYMAKRENPSLKVCATHHGGLGFKTKPVEKMNLIAISKFMAEVYARQLNTSVNFVYNGIDVSKYPFKKERGDRLVYVGRFTSFKGSHVAIQVAKRLNMGLDLVGGAFEEPYFSQQIKPQCDGKQIVLHQEASHEFKVKLLQDAKAILVASNFNEPFGLVVVEANSCGCPAIAWNDGALSEIVLNGVNGFVCEKSLDAMVEAVKRVDEIKPENCRAIVEQNFSRKIMSQRYLGLYRKILDAGEEW